MSVTPDFVHPVQRLHDALKQEDILAAYDAVDATVALIRFQRATNVTLPAPPKRLLH